MQSGSGAPKAVIPRNMQIPLLLFGVVLLIFVGVNFAKNMGWLTPVPKATREAPRTASKQATPTPTKAAPATATSRTVRSVAASAAASARRESLPALEDIRLGSRDPLSPLPGTETEPAPTEPVQPVQPVQQTTPPGPPPRIPGGNLPNPIGQPGIDPTVNPNLVGLAQVSPFDAPPSLPNALDVAYPQAHRGNRVEEIPAPVALVGTISGSNGEMAVMRPNRHRRRPGRLCQARRADWDDRTPGR